GGDTLWLLSQRFGITVGNIKAFNRLKSDALLIGQELKIPVIITETPDTPAWVTTDTYFLSVRKLPDASAEAFAYLNGGMPVTVIGKVINGFYPIRLPDGTTGFSNANYITTDPLIAIPAWVTVGTTNLNVRQIPDISGAIVAVIQGRTPLTITGKAVNNFYPVRLAGGKIGYASVNFITTAESKIEIPAWVTAGTTNLNVRQVPNLSAAVITRIHGGTEITITGQAVNDFYPIRLADGQTGFVSVSFITLERPIRR
ncbi:MAG: SH3 domain-containing protein, partial [Oscillospiraceae bacterium]|nr:SH3 domain-containing protein [Oscillospiraceae bacterium]